MEDVPGTEVAVSGEERARPEPESNPGKELVSGPAGGAQSPAAQVGQTGSSWSLGWGPGAWPRRREAGGAPTFLFALFWILLREVGVQCASAWARS